ncbi:MAG: hypothetical protein WD875_15015 [Pirellulales bacterium]
MPKDRCASADQPSPFAESNYRAALVVAHPGHEMRVHGWLEAACPAVFVLTDGSGRASRSRLASTERLLSRAGAQPGTIFGRTTDRRLYDRLLRRDCDWFDALTDELADELIRLDVDTVVGDPREAAIMAHDVLHGVIDAAIDRVAARTGRLLASYAFPLDLSPLACPAQSRAISHCVALDNAAYRRKLAAARDYSELQDEVDAALSKYGPDSFRHNLLFPVSRDGLCCDNATKPAYETHGEQLVAQGVYPDVVRWSDHVHPLLSALGATYAEVA